MFQTFLLDQQKASLKQKLLFVFFLLMFSLVAVTAQMRSNLPLAAMCRDGCLALGGFSFLLLLASTIFSLFLAYWSNAVTSPSEDVEYVEPFVHLYFWALIYLTLNYFFEPYGYWLEVFNAFEYHLAGKGGF